MGLLNKKPKKTRQSAPRSKKTFEVIADKILVKAMRDNPELALRIALKYTGIDLPEVDEFEKAKKELLTDLMKRDPEFRELIKQEYIHKHHLRPDPDQQLKDVINNLTIDKIKTDRNVRDEIVTTKLEHVMGKYQEGSVDSFKELIDKIKQFQELKAMLNMMPENKQEGFLESLGKVLLKPEVIITLVNIIKGFTSGTSPSLPLQPIQYPIVLAPEQMPLIEETQTPAGTTINNNMVSQISDSTSSPSIPTPVAPRTVSQQLEVTMEPPVPTVEETKTVAVPVTNDEIQFFFESEPEEFVIKLKQGCKNNDVVALTHYLMLTHTTPHEFIELIEAIPEHIPEQDLLLIHLRNNTEWLEKVMARLKSLQEEQKPG